MDAVIWTALAPNFLEVTKKPYSVEAAVDYLANLSMETAARAGDYIDRTLPEIDTPLRRALALHKNRH